ncbi:MAG: GGDEF domain-containing protein [Thermoleophilia bacterium]
MSLKDGKRGRAKRHQKLAVLKAPAVSSKTAGGRAKSKPHRKISRPQIAVNGLDIRGANRRLRVLALVCASFFFLWVSLKVFAQADLWPLLAAPILLSAWFFYEVGVLVALALTALLLIQTSFDKSGPMMVSLFTFTVIGLGLAWGQRRQKRLHRRVLRSSLTDSLTGLYNYGYFMEELERELHRADRYGGSVTLVMFDVDHFKLFNDRFGHNAGNEALKAVAAMLKRQKRESDVVARFGGEEFVIVLPGDEAAGIETATRLRQAISQLKIPVGGGATTEITVSAGVCCYPKGAGSKQELLDRVDQLLYLSKKSGRNKVSVAPEKQRLAVS